MDQCFGNRCISIRKMFWRSFEADPSIALRSMLRQVLRHLYTYCTVCCSSPAGHSAASTQAERGEPTI